jgi:hypothetical protein
MKTIIQPGKGYSITYCMPDRVPKRPLMLCERSVCVTTWSDGFRLGSTMEFSGFDDTLNASRLAALERGAREYLHAPTGPEVHGRWCGWRPDEPRRHAADRPRARAASGVDEHRPRHDGHEHRQRTVAGRAVERQCACDRSRALPAGAVCVNAAALLAAYPLLASCRLQRKEDGALGGAKRVKSKCSLTPDRQETTELFREIVRTMI